MEEKVKRVLYVDSEMFPYLNESPVANLNRFLPQGIVESKKEVRCFMPRYGLINERKNSLHEVIRLSGMNIVIDKVDRPLIIKVTSIGAARMQIYFIDNDDFFRRKALYHDDSGKFFEDNGQRAIFFARGVLETVKKLRWAPDVIHCSGWISHVLPLYLKKRYSLDPLFENSKVVVSLYDDVKDEKFSSDFASEMCFDNVSLEDIPDFENPDTNSLARLAIKYSDGVIMGSEGVNPELATYAQTLGVPVLEYSKEAQETGSYVNQYSDFYEKIF